MGKRILIVEDDPDALELLGMYFDAQGFAVTSARDGQEGWNAFLSQRPSVVLSDYLMPNMDGVTLCEKMRSDARYASIPFVLMTGTPHLPVSTCPDLMMSKPLRLDRLMEYIGTLPN